MKAVTIYTDGSSRGNPGSGGWAAVLVYGHKIKEIYGSEKQTTNNRMEITAVIKALELLKEPCNVLVYSDSRYFCDSLEKGWAKSWKKNNWKKSDGKLALNVDLWDRLLTLAEIHKVRTIWLKGHAGNKINERCDYLATNAAKSILED